MSTLAQKPLTPAQSEIIILIEQGFSNKEIAEKLIKTETTIKAHLRDAFTRLGAKSRTQAVKFFKQICDICGNCINDCHCFE